MRRYRFFGILFLVGLFPLMAAEDRHFIQPDDYFLFDEAMTPEPPASMYVHLAKQLTPPSAKTKGEAHFLRVSDGKKIWTKHFTKTRIAVKADLVLGAEIILFEANGQDDGLHAPANKSAARSEAWVWAVITDTSDMYKNIVTTSGGYKVNLNNIRVVVDPTGKVKRRNPGG